MMRSHWLLKPGSACWLLNFCYQIDLTEGEFQGEKSVMIPVEVLMKSWLAHQSSSSGAAPACPEEQVCSGAPFSWPAQRCWLVALHCSPHPSCSAHSAAFASATRSAFGEAVAAVD